MADDASALFNLLTGYSQGHEWRKLVVAPTDLHRRTIELIDEQTERASEGKPSRIFAKLNALVDHRVIEALYRASQAGVPIDLVDPRHLLPAAGPAGHFGEHPRDAASSIASWSTAGFTCSAPTTKPRYFSRSADWMPRNFDRRVEVMFPIEQADLRDRILHEIVPAYLKDNVKARILQPDGTYVRLKAAEGETPFRVQERFLALHPAVTAAAGDVRLAPAADLQLAATNADGSAVPRRRQRRRIDEPRWQRFAAIRSDSRTEGERVSSPIYSAFDLSSNPCQYACACSR